MEQKLTNLEIAIDNYLKHRMESLLEKMDSIILKLEKLK